MTHPTWELSIDNTDAALVLTACPGTKGTALRASLEQLKQQGVRAIVTALSYEEMEKAGVAQLPDLTQELGMSWCYQPIEDDCAPNSDFDTGWQRNSPELQSILDQGGKVALHCMGGSGRTGLLAAHVLLQRGWDLDTIKTEVKALRPGAFTKQVQLDYIDGVAEKLAK
ncbi:phosphatase [Vibrio sp. HA2012]|uniref:cyclin-dependent kinase inhibitor 3 family protein n=1 Tax=Vibrio sp. HA2012 TaxID=1971595 RepID=UPI000C2B8F58|nr:cyclin-dependent kinase inhibitor 3 family protein [Vibrio sp. HA2012]PJC84989.1 phosphatase [Vibrio sp. HA2012]